MVRRSNKGVPRIKRAKGKEQEPPRITAGDLGQKLEVYKIELQGRRMALLEAQEKATGQVEALMVQLKEMIGLQIQDEGRLEELLKMQAELAMD